MNEYNEFEENFYLLYKANMEISSLDTSHISCEILLDYLKETGENLRRLDKKEPKYLKMYLKEKLNE